MVDEQGGRVINGSMVAPAVSFYQGYDSRMLGEEGRAYDPDLYDALPGGRPLSTDNPLVIDVPPP